MVWHTVDNTYIHIHAHVHKTDRHTHTHTQAAGCNSSQTQSHQQRVGLWRPGLQQCLQQHASAPPVGRSHQAESPPAVMSQTGQPPCCAAYAAHTNARGVCWLCHVCVYVCDTVQRCCVVCCYGMCCLVSLNHPASMYLNRATGKISRVRWFCARKTGLRVSVWQQQSYLASAAIEASSSASGRPRG